ncbi:MAG: divalent metal cation transporter [Bacteroidetes bacterium]|nr:divalent metal cation transporter [Bacteroidota bacterium]
MLKKFLRILGPGLITGASDDDPSGIVTYSQAGAGFGLSTLWTAIFTFPLMAAIQGMCARIGLVTQAGLTGTLRKHYPRPVLLTMLALSFPAIVLNIGADIEAMGAVSNLLVPAIPGYVFSFVFTVLLMYVIIKYPYQRITAILKWLCLAVLIYIIVAFIVHPRWSEVLRSTFLPKIHFTKDYLSILVAILGTTISPYLFFWQATMEAEDCLHKKVIVDKQLLSDMRKDVNIGMLSSNLVMYFIILSTGVVLYNAGIHDINTVEEAAKALEPLAGRAAYLLFAIGVLGTGFLAIPVLGGSLSYIMAETFSWEEGLDKKFAEAKPFYISIIVSLGVGLLLNFTGISPMKALLYTAILYGLTAPVMIAIILHICNNKKIMGEYTNNGFQNVLGILTLVLMTAAAAALIWSLF